MCHDPEKLIKAKNGKEYPEEWTMRVVDLSIENSGVVRIEQTINQKKLIDASQESEDKKYAKLMSLDATLVAMFK
jgi:uncharacterized protein YijF (DUF1287 family)